MADAPPDWLVEHTAVIPDFPVPGVEFRDLSPLWRSSSAMSRCAIALADGVGDVDVVLGIEARGFLAGMIVAQRLGVGFIPARKPGKLPGEVHRIGYTLEYGTDSLEIQRHAISPGDRVLIVDDVIATGGTADAAVRLVELAGGTVVGIRAIIELTALGGRAKLGGHPVDVLWQIG